MIKPIDTEEIYNADSILAVAHGLILGDNSKVQRQQNLLKIVSVTPGFDKKVSSYDVTTVSLNDNYDMTYGYRLMVSDLSAGIKHKTLYLGDDKSIEASASRSWESIECSDYYEEKLFGNNVTVKKSQKNISYCIATEESITAEGEFKSSELNNNIDIVFSNIKIKDGLFTTWVAE